PETVKKFLAEARAIAGLDHPHIVHTLDVASEGDRYFIVFEYLEGRDLARVVRESGPLSPRDALDLVLQAADGLAFAHAREVIHSDLKPANLLQASDGKLKLLDLGVAKLSSAYAGSAGGEAGEADAPADSGAFLSPEQKSGGAADARSDLFSLGAVWYFLLTGRELERPAKTEGSSADWNGADSAAATVRKVAPQAPAAYLDLLRQLLAAAPEKRPPSAVEVVVELTRLKQLLAPPKPTVGSRSGAGGKPSESSSAELSSAESSSDGISAVASRATSAGAPKSRGTAEEASDPDRTVSVEIPGGRASKLVGNEATVGVTNDKTSAVPKPSNAAGGPRAAAPPPRRPLAKAKPLSATPGKPGADALPSKSSSDDADEIVALEAADDSPAESAAEPPSGG
ncbi:MAG TPA: serine/threonine-protein kinase, partial [Pirellulaceae bacterium]|nr:serine/threonine-protein kinase [Pirellulaceae bacterium]